MSVRYMVVRAKGAGGRSRRHKRSIYRVGSRAELEIYEAAEIGWPVTIDGAIWKDATEQEEEEIAISDNLKDAVDGYANTVGSLRDTSLSASDQRLRRKPEGQICSRRRP